MADEIRGHALCAECDFWDETYYPKKGVFTCERCGSHNVKYLTAKEYSDLRYDWEFGSDD